MNHSSSLLYFWTRTGVSRKCRGNMCSSACWNFGWGPGPMTWGHQKWEFYHSLKLTANGPENRPSQNSSSNYLTFRGELLVSGSVIASQKTKEIVVGRYWKFECNPLGAMDRFLFQELVLLVVGKWKHTTKLADQQPGLLVVVVVVVLDWKIKLEEWL